MIELNLQMFGGGKSGAGGGAGGGSGSGKSTSVSKESFGSHGSAGGRMSGSYGRPEEERKYAYIPGDRTRSLQYDPNESVMKIEKDAEYYLVRGAYSNNKSSNYGIVTGPEAKELLKGYKPDERYPGMWYSDKANKYFTVYRVRKHLR